MNFKEIVEGGVNDLVSWTVAATGGGMLWLIRRVFTNQKQIELLQKELEAREDMRQRDREDLKEVKADVKEVNRVLLKVLGDDK